MYIRLPSLILPLCISTVSFLKKESFRRWFIETVFDVKTRSVAAHSHNYHQYQYFFLSPYKFTFLLSLGLGYLEEDSMRGAFLFYGAAFDECLKLFKLFFFKPFSTRSDLYVNALVPWLRILKNGSHFNDVWNGRKCWCRRKGQLLRRRMNNVV